MNTTTIRSNTSSATQHKQNITARGRGISAVSVPPVRPGALPPFAVTQVGNFASAIAFETTNYTASSGRSSEQIRDLSNRRTMDDNDLSLRFGILWRPWMP